MNKREFFLAAMDAQEFKRRVWVISAFSLIKENPEAWRTDPYPFRIVQTPSAYFYVDPDNKNQLTRIDDAVIGQPLFHVKEPVALHAGQPPNLTEDIVSTYGRLLFNYTAFVYPLDSKLPYLNHRVSPKEVENLILPRLKDTPEDITTRNRQDIYVDEYLQFCDAMFFLAGFTQLCVPAATRKTMTAAPGIVEYKEKLLAENAGRLNDPAVIAKIDALLVQYDKDYLKGDEGTGFLITGKSMNIVRKKLFGMHGAEVGLEEGIEVDLIKNSLSQGWDISKFPAMNNSLRAGSYNRGAQTMLGGESVKWLLRASSNISVTADDCGSKLGNVINVDNSNYKFLIGFNVVAEQGPSVNVPDDAAAKAMIGRTAMVRSPMFCKLEKTDYCKACVGARLSENPTGLSAAISEYGSAFLGIYMSAAHAKALVLAKMNYKTAIM